MNNHTFAPDSSAEDRPGKVVGCILCGLPEQNRVHADVAPDDSARITGDRVEAGK